VLWSFNWFHHVVGVRSSGLDTCLASEGALVQFSWAAQTHFSTLPLSPHQLMSCLDVWRHLTWESAKIRIAQDNIAQKRQHAQPAHVEEGDARTQLGFIVFLGAIQSIT
jgi:hypothetical protein